MWDGLAEESTFEATLHFRYFRWTVLNATQSISTCAIHEIGRALRDEVVRRMREELVHDLGREEMFDDRDPALADLFDDIARWILRTEPPDGDTHAILLLPLILPARQIPLESTDLSH